MNEPDFIFRVAGLGQAFDPTGMGFPAAEGADIKCLRPQCHVQRGIVEFRIMGQGHHGGAVVDAERVQRIVRPVFTQGDAGKAVACRKGAAWIDDDHLIARGLGEGDEWLSDMDGADNDHPFGRVENLHEQRGVIATQAPALVVTQCVAGGIEGVVIKRERALGPIAEDEGLVAGLEIRHERNLLLGRAGRQE